ncbi:MAG: NADH-quinone oxidoreductase subunit J [Actinobacteria bacterium]|nr:NADH-quinone oxidoreductase subunit J [Actinomycetota bacterium]
MSVQLVVFFICALIALFGAGGVVWSRSPVHSALSLVATLFAIAVLFLNQNAQFLAAVQVIVYTGAIVILILFVIMLLGVDKLENLADEPLGIGFRVAGGVVAVALLAVLLAVFFFGGRTIVTGKPAQATFGGTSTYQPISQQAVSNPQAGVIDTADVPNINLLGKQIFTQYILAFEVTAALLTIAVVGAVVMAHRSKQVQPIPDEPESLDSGADLAAIDAAGEEVREA